MNIWILNHYASPPDIPGSTRHFDLAREITGRGHTVCIFASGFKHHTRRKERLEGSKLSAQRETKDGVEFVWLKTYPYTRSDWRRVVGMLSYGFRVVPLALRLNQSPDVILASSPHLIAGLAGYVLARLKKARFVLEVRDLWPQTFVEIGGYSDRSLIVRSLRLVEKFLYRRASKIVVLPPMASDYITALGIPKSKIVNVPNGVDLKASYRGSARLPSELAGRIYRLKSEGKMLAGYAGSHGLANNLDTVIEAARILRDRGEKRVHFLLVGEGPEKDRLVRKVEGLGLSNVSFEKSVPKYMLPEVLAKIDIAIRSGRQSGLAKFGISPNKVFDYMASARPIVWTTNSINNPVIEAGCGISVAPENAGEMAEAIVQLSLLSADARRDMGRRGYEYVAKYHSMPVLADRLLAALEDGAHRDPGGGAAPAA